jgi:hypothetical protein
MSDSIFNSDAEGAEEAASEVQAETDKKRAAGAYDGLNIRKDGANLAELSSKGELVENYLETLHEGVFVDITDFEIEERRTMLPGLVIAFKRLLWKMLKFYTFRLWSQQNEVNGLLLSTIEAIESSHRDKIKDLEARVDELEKQLKAQ